eukprot:GEMP01031977.1.p2 GENE.GEMP01031977.1~~GEMP01031977.1.p2  ORF type:complete len:221 (+),score=60.46 GEMP01031977.1:1254-1916(+)
MIPSLSPDNSKLAPSSPSPSPSRELSSPTDKKKPQSVPEWGYGKYDWVMPCSDDIRPTSPPRSSTLVRAEDLLGAKELYTAPSFAELAGPSFPAGMHDVDESLEDGIDSPRSGEDLGAFTERVCKLERLGEEDILKEQERRMGRANQKHVANRTHEETTDNDAQQKAELECGSQNDADGNNKAREEATEGGKKTMGADDANDLGGDGSDALLENWLKQRW